MDATNLQATNKQVTNKDGVITVCTHSRMVDNVLTRSKKRTGKVRCLECGAVVDDPYQELNP